VRLLAQIGSRFGVVVSQKVAVQAVPVLGAIGGAAVNAAFVDHFQTLARGHFIVRRLERTLAVNAHVAVIDFAELRILIYLGRRPLETRAAEETVERLPRSAKGRRIRDRARQEIAPDRLARGPRLPLSLWRQLDRVISHLPTLHQPDVRG